MNQQSVYEVLIQIKDRLDGLDRAKKKLDETEKSAKALGGALGDISSGLGIARMITLAGAVAMVAGAIKGLASGALDMADAVKNGAANIDMGTEAFQVYSTKLKQVGGDAQQLTQAHGNLTRALVEARDASSSASLAFKLLHLDNRLIEQMRPEDRWVAIGRAVNAAADKQQAYAAAAQILGSRGLPTLLAALKEIAGDGYDKVASAAKQAGQIMEDETIRRLEKAKTAWENLKRSLTISTGEAISSFASGARIIGGDINREEALKLKPQADDLSEKLAGIKSRAERDALVIEIRARQKQLADEIAAAKAELKRSADWAVAHIMGMDEAAAEKKYGANPNPTGDDEWQARKLGEVKSKTALSQKYGDTVGMLESPEGNHLIAKNVGEAPLRELAKAQDEAAQKQERLDGALREFFDSMDNMGRMVSDSLADAYKRAPELEAALQKAQLESRWDKADNAGRLQILDEETARIEKQRDLGLWKAAQADEDWKREQIANAANNEASFALLAIEKQRRDVQAAIVDEKKKELEYAASMAKARSDDAMDKSSNEEKLRLLDEARVRIEQEKQARLQLANSIQNSDQRKAAVLEAERIATLLLLQNAKDRRTVEGDISDQKNKQAEATLNQLRFEREQANNNPLLTKVQKQAIINDLLKREHELLGKMLEARKELLKFETDPKKREKIEGDIQSIEQQMKITGAGTPPKERAIITARNQYNDNHDGTQLTAGEGVEAGIYDAANQLGGIGDNLSNLFSTTLLDSVNAVTDGIYGWITGTESFGDVLRNLGDSIFKEMLSTIVRIGMQWLINTVLVKTGMVSISTTEDAIRTTRTAKNNAAEMSQMGPKTANAMASGISSFGMALVFGALALAMILAAVGAFEKGGPIHGGEQFIRVNERGPEYVMNAEARRKYGDAMLSQINAGTFDPADYASSALATTPISSVASPAADLAQARGSGPAGAGQSAAAALAASMPGAAQSERDTRPMVFFDRDSLAEYILSSGRFNDRVTEVSDRNSYKYA